MYVCEFVTTLSKVNNSGIAKKNKRKIGSDSDSNVSCTALSLTLACSYDSCNVTASTCAQL